MVEVLSADDANVQRWFSDDVFDDRMANVHSERAQVIAEMLVSDRFTAIAPHVAATYRRPSDLVELGDWVGGVIKIHVLPRRRTVEVFRTVHSRSYGVHHDVASLWVYMRDAEQAYIDVVAAPDPAWTWRPPAGELPKPDNVDRLPAVFHRLWPVDEAASSTDYDDSPLSDVDPLPIVEAALRDPQWSFRTVEGIARSTGLDEAEVRAGLYALGDRVRSPLSPDPSGRELYTAADRKPSRRERYLALRQRLATW